MTVACKAGSVLCALRHPSQATCACRDFKLLHAIGGRYMSAAVVL